MTLAKRVVVSRIMAGIALVLGLMVSPVGVFGADLTKAETLYQGTDYEGSLALLDKHSNEAGTLFLIGRVYFMLGDFKKATDYLQQATAAKPNNSEYMDWLGRAYGKRAETSNPLTAPGFASKARQAFERAVQLDPKNSDAMSDLFDYYLDAPGFLGGGYDKAVALADKISAIDPPEGYFEKARLAQKRKEYQSAEQHLRQAVAVAPHEVGHLIALAKLLATEGRTKESDAVFEQAQQVDPNSPRVWFARADLLIKQKRNLDEAKNLLERYVQAPITVDDPPKQEAVRLLKQVGGA
jgi:tetratricopeptide (TPR) repeat protein